MAKRAGSDSSVLYAWPVPSSHGTTTYEVLLHIDGKLSCPCPDWVWPKSPERRALAKQGIRRCKHTDMKADEAAKLYALSQAGKPLPPRPTIGRAVILPTAPTTTGTRLIFGDDDDD